MSDCKAHDLAIARFYYANIGVERYRSPVSGKSTTISLPLFSGRFASSVAAHTAAPEDIPTSTPSLRAIAAPVLNASSFSTGIISSYIFVSSVSGTKPAPMPCILCGPETPFERTGEVSSGIHRHRRSFHRSRLRRQKSRPCRLYLPIFPDLWSRNAPWGLQGL